jgi:hypothetical protein
VSRNERLFSVSRSLKRDKPEPAPKLQLPLLDIKIRSNLIQLRTCVDSAFALVELINYIVSDGDLHQPNVIMSEFMSSSQQQQQQPYSIPKATSAKNFLERKSSQILAEEMTNAINYDTVQTLTHSEAINIINQSIPASQQVSCSIPIQKSSQAHKAGASFTVGTPPATSFSFKSTSSSSFSQQVFYSPQKSQASVSPASQAMSAASSSLQERRIAMAPLPQPSLSFDPRNAANLSNMSLGTGAGSSGGAGSGFGLAGTSSSAESLISDMVKEAMTSNPMIQSVYGSLTTEQLKPEPKPIGKLICFGHSFLGHSKLSN